MLVWISQSSATLFKVTRQKYSCSIKQLMEDDFSSAFSRWNKLFKQVCCKRVLTSSTRTSIWTWLHKCSPVNHPRSRVRHAHRLRWLLRVRTVSSHKWRSIDKNGYLFFNLCTRSRNVEEREWERETEQKLGGMLCFYYGISSWIEENLTVKLDVADLAAREDWLIWWLSTINRSNLSSIFFTKVWICSIFCPMWPIDPSMRWTRARIVDFDRSSPTVGDGLPIVCSILFERRRPLDFTCVD